MYPAAPVIAFQVTVMVFSEAAFVAVSDVFAGPSVRTVTLFFEVCVGSSKRGKTLIPLDNSRDFPDEKHNRYKTDQRVSFQ